MFALEKQIEKKRTKKMERKYFVICPSGDTVCTYLQFTVHK